MTTSTINFPFKYRQHGQAMVEYAILLVLMVTLVMGGLELSVTVYHSKKTGDAAEAGANAWAEAIGYSKSISTDITALSNENFDDLLEKERQGLNIDTDEVLGSWDTETDDQVRPSLSRIGERCIGDIGYDPAVIDFENFISLPIDITRCDPAVERNALYNPSSDPNPTEINGITELLDEIYAFPEYRELDPYVDFFTVCTRNDASTGNVEKIVECKTNRSPIPSVDIYDTDTAPTDGIQDACANPLITPCPDGSEDEDTGTEGLDNDDLTYRKLLILKDLKNSDRYNEATSSMVPTQIINEVFTRRSLGDHNPFNFFRPRCNPLGSSPNANIAPDYDNGLADNTAIYLFNPLPIDITDCTGDDPFRLNRSRMSILRDGYVDPDRNATTDAPNNPAGDQSVEGLTKLNLAVYSQYSEVCVRLSGDDLESPEISIVSCNNFTTNANNRIWLKPPGKMCGAAGGGEVCPDDTNTGVMDLNGATGFYFFGHANDAARGSFQWLNTETPTNSDIFETFRPAFQIVCNGASHREYNNDAAGACFIDDNNDGVNDYQGSFALEVHTRYRAIFESFLTFGLQELTNANLAAYFYNPNGVGTAGNVLIGATGSELGPLGANGRPTVKQFKDFRGCYRVDITPPDKIGEQVNTAVSSCN